MQVHIDGLESVSGGSSPKASKANGQKGKLMKTVMSAVNLSYMQGAEHAMVSPPPPLSPKNKLNIGFRCCIHTLPVWTAYKARIWSHLQPLLAAQDGRP